MRIEIEFRRPDWLTVPKSWRGRLALSLLTVLAVAVPTALASDRFVDVPATNPHHDDINRIAAAGITKGCNPPGNDQYCPEQFVRRDQMASFLQRGLGRAGSARGLAQVTTTEATAVTVALTAPGNGFVLVTAVADITCTCTVLISLMDPLSEEASLYSGQTATGPDTGTTAQTHLFPVTSGARTFQVRARTANGTASVLVEATAIWVPFGPTGSRSLSPRRG